MKITVPLGPRSYAIMIAESYAILPAHLERLGLRGEAWVVSHPALLRRYGASLMRPLTGAGWRVETLTVPESESSKSLSQAQRLIGRLSRATRMHVPVLIAFGGGVIGDLTGFVASVWRRGVPYVQVPTTLLAQVDSAVGGKVGVDVPHAKNMIGAFYQPRLVFNNLAVLSSLPPRQRRSGLAEIIKCGVIADPALFRYLERHLDACLALKRAPVQVMVARACRVKARIVGRDERDVTGLRAQMNFGHTLGHALEAATGYRRWTHGEAISIGMCAAAAMAARAGVCSASTAERITRLLAAAGLPTRTQGVQVAAVRRSLRYDKKFIHGRPRWVLPTGIGRVIVTERVPERVVEDVLGEYVRR